MKTILLKQFYVVYNRRTKTILGESSKIEHRTLTIKINEQDPMSSSNRVILKQISEQLHEEFSDGTGYSFDFDILNFWQLDNIEE